ncbi:DUF2569 family protein [Cyclobacterium marinum]|uniref:DUF3857 domain-containing protein n=1 Tax=Cyclobacterium marinum (strain ATCC 25205 / DSM 745 / LMG 13164 / NCIMB 1802) TaxID=880070 RepID=G0J545_CYCMS|nr:DUF2569 family protein [Cyclobacterium marinum]AEL26729.1 Protein of unknown function DUF2569 [Cyclobacterium marinum DSM 745]
MKQIYIIFFMGFFVFQSHAFQENVTTSIEPSWIDPIPLSKPSIKENWPYYYLDFERQVNLSKQTVFHHYRYQVITTEGMQEMSDISIEFDPSFQKLIFHKIVIEREGISLDQLDLNKITTANTESGKERHLYDGSMTALFHLDGVQKGDVIAVSYSIVGFNPIHLGNFSSSLYHAYTIPVNHINYRIFTEYNQDIYYKNINHEQEPTIRKNGKNKIYSWSSHPESPVELDNNLPSWTIDLPITSISTQQNWEDVVQWALPLFSTKNVSSLLPNLNKEILGEKEITLNLIRYVQDEIRYLGLESGIGAYKPHSPEKVYQQKFGDCKDKSLLLVALLQKEGISAYPLLVNTSIRQNLNQFQPSNRIFDHCVVAINLDDNNYFIDPTLSLQGGDLDHTYFPDYGLGLLVKENNSELITLPKPKKSEINIQEKIYVDSVGGHAMIEIKTIYSGNKADNVRAEFENNPISSIQKEYLNFYNNLYPGIVETEKIRFYDEHRFGNNEVLVEENYKIENFWLENEEENYIYSRVYPLVLESLVNYPNATARNSHYNLGSPFSFKQETQVLLPEPWHVEDSKNEIEGSSYKYTNQIQGYGERIAVQYSYDLYNDFIEGEKVAEFLSAHENIKNDLMFNLTYSSFVASEKKSMLAVFVVLFLLIIGTFYSVKIYKTYDPLPWEYAENKNIGGWLVLPAIGIILTPIQITMNFFSVGYLDEAIWLQAINLELTESLAFELIFNILLIVFSVLLIILFYTRRTSTPKLMILFYVVNLAAILIDTVMTEDNISLENRALIQAFVGAAIWIPYFFFSERVKSTFCKTRRNIEPESKETLPPAPTEVT